MKTIYLKKDVLENLEHEEVMVYVGIKSYMDKHLKITDKDTIPAYLNEDIIIYSLFGKLDTSDVVKRTFKENISKGLKSLIKKNIIPVIEQDKKNYILDLYNFYIDTKEGNFLMVSDEEIKEILMIEAKEKFPLFHYALTVLSTIWTDDEHGYGCIPIDILSELSSITSPTAISYNELLEENQIIYIERNANSIRAKDGTIKNQANTYGRYEDKDKVTRASYSYGDRTFDSTDKLTSNEKRTIKQQYNSLVKGKFKGDIKLLYKNVLKYNSDYWTEFNEGQLDMSIFPSDIETQETKVEEKEVKVKENKVEEIKERYFNQVDKDHSCPFEKPENFYTRAKSKKIEIDTIKHDDDELDYDNAEDIWGNDYDFSDNIIVIKRKPKDEIKHNDFDEIPF